MVDLIRLGNNIRLERLKLRYSQEFLAELAGIQQPHLGKIERGEVDMRVSTLVSILKALNVPFETVYDIHID